MDGGAAARPRRAPLRRRLLERHGLAARARALSRGGRDRQRRAGRDVPVPFAEPAQGRGARTARRARPREGAGLRRDLRRRRRPRDVRGRDGGVRAAGLPDPGRGGGDARGGASGCGAPGRAARRADVARGDRGPARARLRAGDGAGGARLREAENARARGPVRRRARRALLFRRVLRLRLRGPRGPARPRRGRRRETARRDVLRDDAPGRLALRELGRAQLQGRGQGRRDPTRAGGGGGLRARDRPQRDRRRAPRVRGRLGQRAQVEHRALPAPARRGGRRGEA